MKKTIKIRIDGEIVEIVAERNGNTLTVTREGHTVSVELVDDPASGPSLPPPAAAPRASTSGGASAPAGPPRAPAPVPTATSGPGTVTAPMIGTVKEILVHVGDTVESGRQVLMMEAMKMDIEISSPAAGSVTEIYITPGETVKEGQPLMKVG